MKVEKEINNKELIVKVSGQINTLTSIDLEKEICNDLTGIESVTIDLMHVDYISSAGIRVFMYINKQLGYNDALKIINVDHDLYQVLYDVGVTDIINIERYEQ
ncbi:MAG: STAS domain-containing protein [Erysipelotrichaceae bacterium]|nr:STAS domain-containing protein [Erysipelotrichaceae bacterium]